MRDTKPIFIVGSGRSGTRMIMKLLSNIPSIEIHHEYLPIHIQPLSAKYYMGILTKEQVKKELQKLYGAALYYSKANYFVDSSHKLSFLIEPLSELFPEAKFVYITRDGRKVVTSFYHKLPDEIYPDKAIEVLMRWLADRENLPEPAPEKKYWWNVPQKGQPFYEEFKKLSQFQRICFHWMEANRVILRDLKKIPQKQQFYAKLEDLTTNKEVLQSFLAFFGIPYSEEFYTFMQKPQHVLVPIDFDATEEQLREFDAIGGDMMKQLG